MPTCWRYSWTYFSARLKISCFLAAAFFLASALAAVALAAHCSSRFRFFRMVSGTTQKGEGERGKTGSGSESADLRNPG